MNNKFLLPVVLATTLTACATPELKPYANLTASLGSAISEEQGSTLSRLEHVEELRTQLNSNISRRIRHNPEYSDLIARYDQQLKKARDNRIQYEQNAEAIDALMDVAVAYSNTLVEVAEAGEGGEAAWKKITGTVRQAANTLNIGLPAGSTALAIVDRVIGTIATFTTRVEAQKTLEHAMAEAAPVVDSIRDGIVELYNSRTGAQLTVVTGVAWDEKNLLEELAGANRLVLYKGIAVDQAVAYNDNPNSARLDTRLEHYFGSLAEKLGRQKPEDGICGLPAYPAKAGSQPEERANCLTGQDIQSLAALNDILQNIQPVYEQNLKDIAAVNQWQRKRIMVAARIVSAINKWQQEHDRLLTRFKECGGLRALNRNCGNLTFANLKLTVERLRQVAGIRR